MLNIQKAMPTIVLELYESLSDGVYSFITFWIANVYTAFSSGDVQVCFKEKSQMQNLTEHHFSLYQGYLFFNSPPLFSI